jgi:DNA polymerase III subunit delta
MSMTVTLIHGDNQIEIDDALRKIRAPFNDADILTYDGPIVALGTLSEACLTAGLFDPERLVIVHDLQERIKGTKKDTSEAEEVQKILVSVAPTTTLLLLSPGMSTDNPLVSSVRKAGGDVRSLTVPRKSDLPRWVIGRGKQHGVTVDRDAAILLTELVGADTVSLDTELEKLATYVGSEGRIAVPVVDSLVGAVTQDSIFALVDAIATGDHKNAFRLLHAQLDSSSTNAIEFALYLIRMLARQVRILLRIRLGQSAGKGQGAIASELRLAPYYTDRYFRQAKRLSNERLRDSFEALAALEYALKQGKADASTGLDLLVADLCE